MQGFSFTFQCVFLHAHAGLCLPHFQVTIRTAPVGSRVCDVTRWGLLIANRLTWARQWTCSLGNLKTKLWDFDLDPGSPQPVELKTCCYGFLNELKTQKAKEQIGRTTTSSSWFGFTLPAGHRACPTSGWHCYDAWIGQQFSHTSHAGCEYAHLSTEYVSLESLDFFLKIYLNHTSVAWDGNQVGNRSRGQDLKSINDVLFFKNTYVVNVCSSNGKSLPNFCVNMKKHSWSHSA